MVGKLVAARKLVFVVKTQYAIMSQLEGLSLAYAPSLDGSPPEMGCWCKVIEGKVYYGLAYQGQLGRRTKLSLS